MSMNEDDLVLVNPENPPEPLTDAACTEIAAIALRQKRANGVLMKAINFVGGQVEDGMKILPKSVRGQIDSAAKSALEKSYGAAEKSRGGRLGGSDGMHKVIGAISGAIGGVGGLPTALAELPVATTVIFRAVQHVAESYGEDPTSDKTRLECLAVFGAGGPGAEDDGVNTSFVGARLSLSGTAVNALISRIAPKFGAVLSQKLATQAVPILGAAAGAGTNFAFVDYYVSMAHVHFGLRKIARVHGNAAVEAEFHRVLVTKDIPVKRA
jgi:hypothetical protein